MAWVTAGVRGCPPTSTASPAAGTHGPETSKAPRPPGPAHLARWQGSQSQPCSSGWAWLQPWQVKRWQLWHRLLGDSRSL